MHLENEYRNVPIGLVMNASRDRPIDTIGRSRNSIGLLRGELHECLTVCAVRSVY